MLRRFSLYGFLKNQQYYEMFFMLAMTVEKGLSYTMFGLLVCFREVMVNLIEIPSGAVADVWGRRRSMILSFVAYIISFALFGLSRNVALLFVAMFFFAIGDAFRTGTHKAMIFTWLALQNRTDEKTRTYGYTRSWSKFGSALAVVIATAIVLGTGSCAYLFYFCIIPYVLQIINFLGYPEELDGESRREISLDRMLSHLRESLEAAFRRADLRRLIFESMGFEGFFKASKDYLQPVLMSAAVLLTTMLATLPMFDRFGDLSKLSELRKAALLVGPIYFVLYLLSAAASRNAHRLVPGPHAEDTAARRLWGLMLLTFVALLPALVFGVHVAIIAGFMALFVLQNLWRPVLISRFDAHSRPEQKATILSIESQAKTLSTALIAPTLGFAVDTVKAHGNLGGQFWPIGAVGLVLALGFFVTARPRGNSSPTLHGER